MTLWLPKSHQFMLEVEVNVFVLNVKKFPQGVTEKCTNWNIMPAATSVAGADIKSHSSSATRAWATQKQCLHASGVMWCVLSLFCLSLYLWILPLSPTVCFCQSDSYIHTYLQLINTMWVDGSSWTKTRDGVQKHGRSQCAWLRGTIGKLLLHLHPPAAGLVHLAGEHSLCSKALDHNIHHCTLIYIHPLGCCYHHCPTAISHTGNVSG